MKNQNTSFFVEDRLDKLLKGIEFERKHEEHFYLSILSNRPIKEKVEDGFAWHPVEITKKHYTVGEYVEIEIHRIDTDSPNHRIKVGAGVSLFINLHDETQQFSGTVSYLRKDKMRIILNDELLDKEDIPTKGSIGVELIYDERPYKIMKEAIDNLKSTKNEAHQQLKKGIHNLEPFDYDIPVKDYYPITQLNESQNQAIAGCLKAERLAIVHGPPGTGKTTTIVGLVEKLLTTEKQVLVCAPSNNAVDLLASRLDAKGLKVLRIGNITRMDDNLIHLTLEEKVRGSQEWTQIKKIKIEADELSKKANKFKRSFGPAERKQRYELRKEAREIRKWAKELEYRLTQSIIADCQVVLATLIGASHNYIKNKTFATCIIDEASQTLEPECWNVMLKAEKTILVGDHKQLPPTVKSKEAQNLGFEETILDRMTSIIKHSYLLDTQYRMNNHILNFPNIHYYHGRLKSASSAANLTLENDTSPVEFIDTVGTGFEEEQIPGESSHFNKGEYFIIREHLLSISDKIYNQSIGIITPYAEQVRYIKREIQEDEILKSLNIQIDSIDGFQGQEKDIIYISLVRSNDQNEIGFLKDERRLNVGLTRAKKKLVIVGDSNTIGSNSTYSNLIQHIEEKENYRSAWEFMA